MKANDLKDSRHRLKINVAEKLYTALISRSRPAG